MGKWCRVAGVGEVRPGESRVCEASGKAIALCNVDGDLHAIDNTCPHRGGPLGGGFLNGTLVTCPWHGWAFDVVTGEAPHDPDSKVPRYAVRVDGDDVLVEMDEGADDA